MDNVRAQAEAMYNHAEWLCKELEEKEERCSGAAEPLSADERELWLLAKHVMDEVPRRVELTVAERHKVKAEI